MRNFIKLGFAGNNELVELRLQPTYNLKRGVKKLLVYQQTVVFKVDATSKRHHAVVYPAAMIA